MYNINNRDACPTNSASLPSTLDSYNIGSTPCKFTSTTVRILPMQVHSNEPRRSTERNSPPSTSHISARSIFLAVGCREGRERSSTWLEMNTGPPFGPNPSGGFFGWATSVNWIGNPRFPQKIRSLPEGLTDGSTRDHVNRGPDGRVETRQSWT